MENKIKQLSFRDPSGFVMDYDDRVIRFVLEDGRDDLIGFLDSDESRSWVDAGKLVKTHVLNDSQKHAIYEGLQRVLKERDPMPVPKGGTILEHERVFFSSYSCEWPAEMLWAAASLTLDLAERALVSGFNLKDATPRNIFYSGTKPIFIDVLSFEKKVSTQGVWNPYSQFVRSFVLPLLVKKYFGLTHRHLVAGKEDALSTEDVFKMAGFFRRFTPPFLGLVTIPVLLERRMNFNGAYYRPPVVGDAEVSRFILKRIFKGLRRTLNRVRPMKQTQVRETSWLGYEETEDLSAGFFRAKSEWVEDTLRASPCATILDMGCNTGHFSLMAARLGSRVVAIDSDPDVVGETWRRAERGGFDVLPLVVDISNPTPAMGWANTEVPSFLDRAREKFDGVMMLGLLHHLAVTERIPLSKIIDTAAQLTRKNFIVEFIGRDDAKFQDLVRGRDHLFNNWSRDVFENLLKARFDIVKVSQLGDSHRWLYFAQKKK